jgi:hypothetical protein
MYSSSTSSVNSRAIKSSQLKQKVSKSTQQLLDSMMKDSKLTKYQMAQVQSAAKNQTSLPSKGIAPSRAQQKNNELYEFKQRYIMEHANMFGQKKYSIPKKRSLNTMIIDGAFDQEMYRPSPVRVNRDLEKDKLSTYFEFGGKDRTPQEIIDARFNKNKTVPTRASSSVKKNEKDRFIELLEEIEERHTWLQEMKAVGEGQKYEALIRPQLSSLLNEMKLIDKERCTELMRIIQFQES